MDVEIESSNEGINEYKIIQTDHIHHHSQKHINKPAENNELDLQPSLELNEIIGKNHNKHSNLEDDSKDKLIEKSIQNEPLLFSTKEKQTNMNQTENEKINPIENHHHHHHENETLKSKIERMTKPIAGSLYMVLAALSFSGMALFAKLSASSGKTPAFEILLSRNGFMFVVTVIFLAATKDYPWKVKKEQRMPLITRGVLSFFGQSCYFYSLTQLDISTAVTLSFTSPVLSALIAIPILKEKPTRYDLIGCVLCLVGVILIMKPISLFTEELDLKRIIGILVALVGACFTAFFPVLIRKLGTSGVSPFMIVLSVSFFCSIGSPFGMLIFENPDAWQIPNVSTALFLLFTGVAGMFGQFLQNKAFSLEPVAKVSTVGYVQICFAFLFQLTIFGEIPDLFSIGGAILVSAWAVVVVVRSWRARART